MKATPQQLDLYRWIDSGSGHGLLTSVAGSGKTTSIIECLNFIDDEDQVILCSFTKLIAGELANRVKERNFINVNSTTLNSLGWGLCRENIPNVKLDQFKTDNILKYHLSSTPLERWFQEKVYSVVKGSLKRVVGLLKSYVVRNNTSDWIDRILKDFDIELPDGSSDQADYARENFKKLVDKVYWTSVEFTQECDFDDQKMMPCYYGWKGKAPAWIIVDECQDVNFCDIKLIESFLGIYKNQPTRLLFVGDPNQSIYGFRGSLPDACDQIKEKFNCKELKLTICFRCPDKVLELAKEIVPIIEVICRTTAPLVKRCLEFVRKGIPALVKGKDLGRSLLQLMDIIIKELEKSGIFEDPLNMDYLRRFIKELGLYKSQLVQNYSAAGRDEAAIAISDRCEALESFCLDSKLLAEVAGKIDSLFQDNVSENDVILFLSGHRCKGLQQKRIYFLRSDLCPHSKAKSKTALIQEKNLKYVIITRSESELYFVQKEDDEK